MTGVCKFCKCTEDSPCWIPLPDHPRTAVEPCSWLLDDVCTNPDCVLKAYLEARPHAESLMHALELLEVA